MRTKGGVAGLTSLLFVMPCISRCQAPAKLEFEVATVRPSSAQSTGPAGARQWKSGGPGTDDPGRLTYTLMPLRYLIRDAYEVQLDQIAGPDFINNSRGFTDKYDITAKVPLGATRADVDLMLRALLIERFDLSVRMEAREMPGYVLTVAKGGPKFKESVADPAAKPAVSEASCRGGRDADGLPQMPAGCRGQFTVHPRGSGDTYVIARQVPMASLVSALTVPLGVAADRFVDETGWKGNYEYRLGFSGTGLSAAAPASQDPSGLPDLFGALEKQLGLKLEKTKLSINMVIIDHVDKVPADN